MRSERFGVQYQPQEQTDLMDVGTAGAACCWWEGERERFGVQCQAKDETGLMGVGELLGLPVAGGREREGERLGAGPLLPFRVLHNALNTPTHAEAGKHCSPVRLVRPFRHCARRSAGAAAH